MSDLKPLGTTPGPWKIVEREVLEDGSVYPRHIVGGEQELTVCYLEAKAVAELAIKHPESRLGQNRNGNALVALPDLEQVACRIWEEHETGKAVLNTATMLLLRDALIKAGHMELRIDRERVRHIRIWGDN